MGKNISLFSRYNQNENKTTNQGLLKKSEKIINTEKEGYKTTENCKENTSKVAKTLHLISLATHPFLFSLSFDTEIEGKKVWSGLEHKPGKPSINN